MKFDSRELERVVERAMQGPPRWRPASHRFVNMVETAVCGGILAYWLYGLLGVFL